MAGTEITCWECHGKVVVPHPRATPWETVHAFHGAWDESFRQESLGLSILTALALTAMLCISHVGLIAGAVGLVLASIGYGELIRRGGRLGGETAEPGWRSPRRLVARGLAVALFALGLSTPTILSILGMSGMARLNVFGWLGVLVAVAVLPLAMATAFARDEKGPLGLRRVARALRRHPIAALAMLAVLPLAALLGEGMLLALARYFDILGYLLGDVFPDIDALCKRLNLPSYAVYTLGSSSEPQIMRIYIRELSQGYSLLGGIPRSLSTTLGLVDPWALEMPDTRYYAARIFMTQLAATGMLLALGLQARWVALLVSLDAWQNKKATATTVAPATTGEPLTPGA
jgi:hypothetical protein